MRNNTINYQRHGISLQGKIMSKDSKRQSLDAQLRGRRCWILRFAVEELRRRFGFLRQLIEKARQSASR
jgi:hypothetical protein